MRATIDEMIDRIPLAGCGLAPEGSRAQEPAATPAATPLAITAAHAFTLTGPGPKPKTSHLTRERIDTWGHSGAPTAAELSFLGIKRNVVCIILISFY